ncbi:uncharacterized protein LOC105435526 [Cucumis sativus]|uniref:Uncharacterized protein n=1 Tax=Cucumis sativus TaxID=3659 RepID=A0A0A0KR64_CUCSA|nr:uncharacterized protein LOC105435526 [Cucumis sativus]KGN51389.1 hypothetical protein Csa_008775 [Cucumis sativus]
MEAEEKEEDPPPQLRWEPSSTPTMQEVGGGSGALDLCPSFSSYSFDGPAETAARVAMEFEGMSGEGDGSEENDFEFVLFQKTEDEMILDSPITPVFPVFNHDLFKKSGETEVNELKNGNAPIIRISLQKLIIDDRERERDLDRDLLSASSSETDELEGIPPGTYCVWTPKSVQATERGKCKKSKSTGSSSSKRWRLRNLLPRSGSEGGKNLFVFLTPSSKSTRNKEEKSEKLGEDAKGKKSCSEANKAGIRKSKIKGGSVEKASSAHELFYMRNRMLKEGDKRRSYLPYRQDLVGFWANLNTVSKALPPF